MTPPPLRLAARRLGLSLVEVSRALGGVIATLLLTACATQEKIPTYPWIDAPTALHTISQRWSAWHTLSGTCLITMERPDGQSVRLDGAVAVDASGHLRLRAWKFNQAVFDLTLTPQGLWVLTPQDPARAAQTMSAKVSAAQLAHALELFTGNLAAGAQVLESSGPRMVLRTDTGQGNTALCDLDKTTLTPRRYRMLDAAGAIRFTLTLDHYRDFSGVVWPMRIVADAPDGKITVELSDVEINADLAPGAFLPPARAEKQP